MSKADNERRAVVAWLERRLSKFRYSNNWSTKFNADVSGETDCSGATFCAYQSIGITIGRMSYNQATNGINIATYNGGTAGSVAAFNKVKALLKPGDLIVYKLTYGIGAGKQYNHVDMWRGNDYALDHGGPGMGPTIRNVFNTWLLPRAAGWTVRRIITDTIEQTEIKELTMKYDYIVFETADGKSLCVANLACRTWDVIPNSQTYEAAKRVWDVTDARWIEWKDRPGAATKSNRVDNPYAFGTKVGS